MSDNLKMPVRGVFTDSPKNLLQAQGLFHLARLMNRSIIFDFKCLTTKDGQELLKITEDYRITQAGNGVYFFHNDPAKYDEDYYGDRGPELEKLSVPVLEEMAIGVYTAYYYTNYRRRGEIASEYYMEELLEDILCARKYKLDAEFAFTPENINALLKLDAELVSVQLKAREEMRVHYNELRKRLANKDPFLTDYEIEAVVTPYLDYPDCNENTMSDVFRHLLEENRILHFGARELEKEPDEEKYDPLHRFSSAEDGDYIFGRGWTALKNYKFSYGMHELFDHIHYLSFADLLKIKKLWIDIKIEYQRDNGYTGDEKL